MFIDTHAHLNDEAFSQDLDSVLIRAAEAGVRWINVVGYDLPSSQYAVELANRYPQVYASIGIHPEHAEEWSVDTETALKDLVKQDLNKRIIAIGEIGMDFYYEDSPLPQIQKDAFQAQLRLAYDLDLPVSIHDRDAHQACLEAIEEVKAEGSLRNVPGVFHYYSGSPEFAARLLELGFYFGVDGPVTYKNAKKPQVNAAKLPLERILLETDCPYLSPEPRRGRRNEPCHIPYIAAKVAELRDLSPEQIAEITTQNAETLFQLS